MNIYFVNENGDTIIHAECDAVPRIGEMVTVPADKPHTVTAYRVKDVEWPVVKGPNGSYAQVSVTLSLEPVGS